MIISHRGHHNGLLENTILSFEAALKAGADAVECDLRLTKDRRVVVCHDNKLVLNGKRLKVSKTTLKHLINPNLHAAAPSPDPRLSRRRAPSSAPSPIGRGDGVRDPQNDEQGTLRGLLTIDDLFDYMSQKRVPFFLEVKNRSPILIEEIAKRIKDKKLWSLVHIMGFSLFIKNALRAQAQHEKLRVLPIIANPFYSYIRKPKKSYGVFVGWIDEWYGSGLLFRKLISTNRLKKLKSFYEKNGFKVMAGVINKKNGFEYFKKAGIEDIVTDNIKDAVRYFKKFEYQNSKSETISNDRNKKLKTF